MDSKQNPFSLYDFLGYFTPGAIFIYGFIVIYSYANPGPNVYDQLVFERVEIYIPFVLSAYAIGHILSYLSSVIVERYSIWTIGYPSKYMLGSKVNSYFDVGDKHKKLRVVIRSIVGFFLLPITILDYVICFSLGYRDLYAKPLDKLLINIIKVKIRSLLSECSGLAKPPSGLEFHKADTFRFIYHYVVENSSNHLPKMQNYVALYGFLRTLTFISILFFWVVLGFICFNQFPPFIEYCVLLGVSVLCFIFYMSFIKFYRRFSLEVLMALSAIYVVRVPMEPTA